MTEAEQHLIDVAILVSDRMRDLVAGNQSNQSGRLHIRTALLRRFERARAAARIIGQQELKTLVHYDQETGIFTWKWRQPEYFVSHPAFRCWNTKYAGKRAGTIIHGYRTINIYRNHYRAHRLAHLYMTGHLPTLEIDHINGDRDDNRWINLRQVTASVNMKNLPIPRTNKSGTPGVIWHKRDGKWQASIKVNRRTVHLGYFESKQDAIAARKVAERQYGFHPNHGRLA